MKSELVISLFLLTWVVAAMFFWAIMGRVSYDSKRTDEHSIKLEMLMEGKQNKPSRS